MKRHGFTLSEVLITVGLLGVVASMTMPTLINNYKNQAFATAIKKDVAELMQAIDLMMTEEGKNNIWQTSMIRTESADNFIKTYLDYAEECKEISDCFSDSYTSISGKQTLAIDKINANSTAYMLKNGSAIMIKPNAFESSADWTTRDSLTIFIDTNGKASPNKGGRDMFKIPLYYQNTNGGNFQFGTSANCTKHASGANCYVQLSKDNWKMKY